MGKDYCFTGNHCFLFCSCILTPEKKIDLQNIQDNISDNLSLIVFICVSRDVILFCFFSERLPLEGSLLLLPESAGTLKKIFPISYIFIIYPSL